MKWCLASVRGTTAAFILIALPVSCGKREDAIASDLGEAGYELTREDWFRATRANDVGAMKRFVSGNFDSNTRDEEENTALHIAAESGARDAADYLLNRAAPIDAPNAAGNTPLMLAVIAGHTEMVNWLLRQGADPRTKDQAGYSPLLLAVREGRAGPAAELAPYHRDGLDAALLLAAMLGQTEVIDTLTNYGASVYTRMEDGRTPLMLAAGNGHTDAVKLLIDIGSSRFTTDSEGRTAAMIALDHGEDEIAALLSRQPRPDELALDTPEDIAETMDAYLTAATEGMETPQTTAAIGDPSLPVLAHVDSPSSVDSDPSLAATTSSPGVSGAAFREISSTEHGTNAVTEFPIDPSVRLPVSSHRQPAVSLAGQTVSNAPAAQPTSPGPSTTGSTIPPLVMRHYREREVPVELRSARDGVASLGIPAPGGTRETLVKEGDRIPGSQLVVTNVRVRLEESKHTLGETVEVPVIQVRDVLSGETREWISGIPASAHDPVALVEDAATGRRYLASPGQQFESSDGTRYFISEVRPNQLVIENQDNGTVETIPLRGPRG